MKTTIVLTMGVDAFTPSDLFRKAAIYKGLELGGAGAIYQADSEPIKMYELNDKLLAVLKEQGIKRQLRPDCRNEIFTLIDGSDYWNFELREGKFNLCVSLSVGFEINIKKRGIVFWPQAHGSLISPADPLPNFRMFKALAESDEDAPAIVKELAASDGNIVVIWTDLGLGGICKLANLFEEFAGSNKTIKELNNRGVFDPVPSPQYQQPGNELFVVESAQPKVLERWRTQLNEYRAQLVV